jgi:hypothetical protein
MPTVVLAADDEFIARCKPAEPRRRLVDAVATSAHVVRAVLLFDEGVTVAR